MSSLPEVNEKDFVTQVLQAREPVLVDFWAPWCPPCRMLTPVLEDVAVQMEGRVKVVKLNTDENLGLTQKYGVMSIPSLILFQNGQEAKRLTGFLPQPELVSWLQQAVGAEGKL